MKATCSDIHPLSTYTTLSLPHSTSILFLSPQVTTTSLWSSSHVLVMALKTQEPWQLYLASGAGSCAAEVGTSWSDVIKVRMVVGG